MTVRPLSDADREWARPWIVETWGLPVVSPSGVYDDPVALDGFVAEEGGRPVGLLLHRIDEGRCEVVALVVRERRKGHGRALMEAARAEARNGGCERVWLITTDDNPGALDFYRSLGMTEVHRHLDFVETVRRSKPGSTGYRDAVELEWR
ncbi:MAG TPA: GNAT family N-acetyltransferase [Acidimicrobiales bacterium]|nr:GNAT family N-acetyltransferase [Acidimicrobiales bacterium]